jgi:hypothetical protein
MRTGLANVATLAAVVAESRRARIRLWAIFPDVALLTAIVAGARWHRRTLGGDVATRLADEARLDAGSRAVATNVACRVRIG